MPVYECYCAHCHTVFSFFSRRIDTETRPDCPRCGRPRLARQASLFAIGKRRAAADEGEGGEADLAAGLDEERVAQAFASLERELPGLDETDPRQAARLMRSLFETAGLKPGEGMVEALRRMESGEDPDAVEAQLGEVLDREDGLGALARGVGGGDLLRRLRRDLLPAARDDCWYPLTPADRPSAADAD